MWSGGIRRKWGIINMKNYLEVADPSLNVYVWGSINVEETILGAQ
jgi:hypothetical protein